MIELARKPIGINLDDNDMNNANSNFIELYTKINGIADIEGTKKELNDYISDIDSLGTLIANKGKVFPFQKLNENETDIFNEAFLDVKVHHAEEGALYKVIQLSKNSTAYGAKSSFVTFDKSIDNGATWFSLIQRLHSPLPTDLTGIHSHAITRDDITEIITVTIDWDASPNGSHNVSMTGAEYLVSPTQYLYYEGYKYPTALSMEKFKEPISGKYVRYNTGEFVNNKDYYVYDFLEVVPGLSYIIDPLNQYAWYDERKRYLSGGSRLTTSNPVKAPEKAKFLSVTVSFLDIDKIKIYQSDADLSFVHLDDEDVINVKSLRESNANKILQRKFNVREIFHAWESGEKFPIAFVDDSHTDGAGTTGNIPNELGTDNQSPNAYPKILENRMKKLSGNNALRIYNAGFSGKTAAWMNTNFEAAFGAGTPYADTKMAFIGFGTNDRLNKENPKEYYDAFKSEMEALINKFISKGIQPVMMTEQPTVSPSVSEEYSSTHPLRSAGYINSVSNAVKYDLADSYGLELIDLTDMLRKVISGVSTPLTQIYNANDGLHFGDAGHKLVRDVFTATLYPYTLTVKNSEVIDFTSQHIHKGVPENKVNMSGVYGLIKGYCDYLVTADELLLKQSIFINDNKKYVIRCYKYGAESSVKLKVDGNTLVTPNSTLDSRVDVIELEPGYHELEVQSGTSRAGFRGLSVVEKSFEM